MTRRVLLRWEASGAVLIFLAGFVLHFAFAWSGHWRPLAWLAAVNESTWEHLKLGVWPALLFAALEYAALRRAVPNIWFGKAAALLAMPLVVISCFYGYLALTATDSLVIDILIFLLSILVGQGVSYAILSAHEIKPWLRWVGAATLAAVVLAFALLTYYPPHMFLFQDPVTQGYGILPTYGDVVP